MRITHKEESTTACCIRDRLNPFATPSGLRDYALCENGGLTCAKPRSRRAASVSTYPSLPTNLRPSLSSDTKTRPSRLQHKSPLPSAHPLQSEVCGLHPLPQRPFSDKIDKLAMTPRRDLAWRWPSCDPGQQPLLWPLALSRRRGAQRKAKTFGPSSGLGTPQFNWAPKPRVEARNGQDNYAEACECAGVKSSACNKRASR